MCPPTVLRAAGQNRGRAWRKALSQACLPVRDLGSSCGFVQWICCTQRGKNCFRLNWNSGEITSFDLDAS